MPSRPDVFSGHGCLSMTDFTALWPMSCVITLILFYYIRSSERTSSKIQVTYYKGTRSYRRIVPTIGMLHNNTLRPFPWMVKYRRKITSCKVSTASNLKTSESSNSSKTSGHDIYRSMVRLVIFVRHLHPTLEHHRGEVFIILECEDWPHLLQIALRRDLIPCASSGMLNKSDRFDRPNPSPRGPPIHHHVGCATTAKKPAKSTPTCTSGQVRGVTSQPCWRSGSDPGPAPGGESRSLTRTLPPSPSTLPTPTRTLLHRNLVY